MWGYVLTCTSVEKFGLHQRLHLTSEEVQHQQEQISEFYCEIPDCTERFNGMTQLLSHLHHHIRRGRSRIFERGEGSRLGLPANKGGPRRGSNFGPNVKKPTSWHKRGWVLTPWTPPDPPLHTSRWLYCYLPL